MKPSAAFTCASAALRLSTSVARRLRIAHADRRVAGRRLAPRAAGIAEHPLRELREVGEVLVDEGVAGAAEAVEPVLDVGGVARLRQFAVVDEVDAGIGLLLDHLGDGRAHPLRPARRDRPARLPPWRTSSGSGRPAAAGCRCAWSESVRCCASLPFSGADLRAARMGLSTVDTARTGSCERTRQPCNSCGVFQRGGSIMKSIAKVLLVGAVAVMAIAVSAAPSEAAKKKK